MDFVLAAAVYTGCAVGCLLVADFITGLLRCGGDLRSVECARMVNLFRTRPALAIEPDASIVGIPRRRRALSGYCSDCICCSLHAITPSITKARTRFACTMTELLNSVLDAIGNLRRQR